VQYFMGGHSRTGPSILGFWRENPTCDICALRFHVALQQRNCYTIVIEHHGHTGRPVEAAPSGWMTQAAPGGRLME
jgi:hypothetical protein